MPLASNAVESALRVICLGETGRQFAGATEAAKRLAAILTVIATARANGLNVMGYLTHVFTALPEPGKDDSVALPLPAATKAAGSTT